MAYRVIKSLPKRGTVSRQKLQAAAKTLAKATPRKPVKADKFTRADTASGRKKLAFKRPAFRVA